MSRYRVVVTALGLAALTLLVSAWSLASAPVYLHHDETIYALHGHSLATTGRDMNGLRLPLFIHTFAWVPPIAIYLRALTFLFLPVTPATTRLPGVIVCAVDVALTYIVARRLFRRESIAVLAAIFVMLTPAHFIHARLATDHICHLPFFIASLWFVLDFIERRTL